ncbi:MAG: PIN domain-containing protein [Pseudomonadota bacterium]
MISAVDTNVLLDLLIPNAKFVDRSLACLAQAAEEGLLILNEIVFAELSSQFLNQSDLNQFLSETTIQLRASNEQVLWEAGRAWKEYSKRKTSNVCAACGKTLSVFCTQCGHPIQPKRHIISDFLIGAHAKTFADQLITRDRGFYRRYFKGLTIIDPQLDDVTP